MGKTKALYISGARRVYESTEKELIIAQYDSPCPLRRGGAPDKYPIEEEERDTMNAKGGRTSFLALVLAALFISAFPSVLAITHTERGYKETTVTLMTANATASGPANHDLDVADTDYVIVNVTCNYTDTREYGQNSAPAYHYFNVTVTYQSSTQYDDENVTTYERPDSGTTYLEVSFQVVESTTLYVYEYVSATLTGPEHQDFDEDWYNWTVTLI